MDTVIFTVLLLLVTTAARHHPKVLKKVPCSNEHEWERNNLMEEARCGPPKDVFVPLKHHSITLLVIPSGAWVKRCVGTCDYESGFSCQPTETIIRYIPVRLYNTKMKQSCALFPVEEHVSCGCLSLTSDRTDSDRTASDGIDSDRTDSDRWIPPDPYDVESI